MRIKDIVDKKTDVYIFEVVKEKSDNPLDWKIKPRYEKLIPDTEAHCILRAKMIDSDKNVSDCFINLSLPERIVDYVIYQTNNGLKYNEFYELTDKDVIPAIASEAFGVYELYYSKNNPEIGISILKDGLGSSKEPTAIAEDLGYILRDENRSIESIQAFLISLCSEPSSEFVNSEIKPLFESAQENNFSEYSSFKPVETKFKKGLSLTLKPENSVYGEPTSFIPSNSTVVIDRKMAYLITEYLKVEFPQKEIEFLLNNEMIFVDCGANFEKVICPFCESQLEMEYWQKCMDSAYETNFEDLSFKTNCCDKTTDLDSLQYIGNSGFAKSIISVYSADLEKDDESRVLENLKDLSDIEFKVIYAHY